MLACLHRQIGAMLRQYTDFTLTAANPSSLSLICTSYAISPAHGCASVRGTSRHIRTSSFQSIDPAAALFNSFTNSAIIVSCHSKIQLSFSKSESISSILSRKLYRSRISDLLFLGIVISFSGQSAFALYFEISPTGYCPYLS